MADQEEMYKTDEELEHEQHEDVPTDRPDAYDAEDYEGPEVRPGLASERLTEQEEEAKEGQEEGERYNAEKESFLSHAASGELGIVRVHPPHDPVERAKFDADPKAYIAAREELAARIHRASDNPYERGILTKRIFATGEDQPEVAEKRAGRVLSKDAPAFVPKGAGAALTVAQPEAAETAGQKAVKEAEEAREKEIAEANRAEVQRLLAARQAIIAQPGEAAPRRRVIGK
jgi:hypothetical protein